jgi:hypothetical protein
MYGKKFRLFSIGKHESEQILDVLLTPKSHTEIDVLFYNLLDECKKGKDFRNFLMKIEYVDN